MDWRKEADRVLAFIDECLAFPASEAEVSNVARADLYAAFCKFLDERGHAKWSQETFLSRFRSHELIRSRQVEEGQTRNHDTLSRPPLGPNVTFSSSVPQLPKVVRVFKGVTFRADDED
jgi:phage/plasmid-associated DNA primase